MASDFSSSNYIGSVSVSHDSHLFRSDSVHVQPRVDVNYTNIIS